MSDQNESTERFLLLIRHGVAEEVSETKRDFDRSLTPDGQSKMKEISRAIGKLFPKAQLIISSPFVRASQTALFLSKSFESSIEVRTSDLLVPQSTRADFRKLLEETKERRVIVVGHEPNLTEAMFELTGMSGSVQLRKGGCYGVSFDGAGNGTLEWLLPPRVLRRM